MQKTLSILLPSYNNKCYTLVETLKRQADGIDGLVYEIIVADDGSRDQVAVISNLRINELEHCRYIRRYENVGRSVIRNFLASEALYERLLFMDSDVTIVRSDFIKTYLESISDVVDGGVTVIGRERPWCLRYKYEKAAEPFHTAECRKKEGFRNFHTANFMVSRKVFQRCRFDESITQYGYEDLLFGLDLEAAGFSLEHIDNPVGLDIDEPNAHFLAKTDESIIVLHSLRDRIAATSRIIQTVSHLRSLHLLWALKLWHRLFSRLERRNLLGRKPSLTIFKLYKIGAFSIHNA